VAWQRVYYERGGEPAAVHGGGLRRRRLPRPRGEQTRGHGPHL